MSRRIGRRWLLLAILLLVGGMGATAYPLGLVTGVGIFAGLPQRVIAQMHNYDELNEPFYSGNYVGAKLADAAELVVVTYNLRYARQSPRRSTPIARLSPCLRQTSCCCRKWTKPA